MTSSGRKLRVALLLDSYVLPAWQVLMLEELKHCAELVLVILKETAAPEQLDAGANHTLFRWYMKLEQRLFKSDPDPLELRDLSNQLSDLPIFKVTLENRAGKLNFSNADLEQLKTYRLDVIVQLISDEIVAPDLVHYGIWRYDEASQGAHRGSAASVREVLAGKALTGSSLHTDNGQTLYYSQNVADYLSVNRTRQGQLWKSAYFVPRLLSEPRSARAKTPALGTHSKPPGNLEMLSLISKHVLRYGKFKISTRLFPEQWVLLYQLGQERSTDLASFKMLIPPKDRFWADPFVYYREGSYAIFIEELPYASNKGHISVITMDEAGNVSQPVPIIEQPYHLSYPFLLSWEGDLYMIPETSANDSIEVYKCQRYPDEWVFHKTLMRGVKAYDATFYPHAGKWWLFVNMQLHKAISDWDELFLFYGDSPLSADWKPHPLNPIVSDVSRARPAGAFFEEAGQLYRPSQDSSRGYGYAIKVNRIITLNETDYLEEEVSSLEPHWDKRITGIHTLNHSHQLTVADAKLKQFLKARKNI